MNLFEINESIRYALDSIRAEAEQNDGVISDELMEVMQVLKATQEEKLENISLYIKELKTESEALKAEAKKLTERARTAENHADRLKEYLINGMEEAGLDKFKTSRVALSFRKSSSVVIDDLDAIPSEFIKIEKSANKTEIKKALASGDVAGAHIEENQSLIIK